MSWISCRLLLPRWHLPPHSLLHPQEHKVKESTLRTFLLSVRQYYHKENPYHNFGPRPCPLGPLPTWPSQQLTLAGLVTDVTWGVYWLLKNTLVRQFLTGMDVIALLTATIGHDIDHPGTTNSFLVAITAPIAVPLPPPSLHPISRGPHPIPSRPIPASARG
jgi:hypothetical protein